MDSGHSPGDLPPQLRLVLAYAPRRTHAAWRALLELDWRLGQVVRLAREPLLAQMRLAWWRDRLGESADVWPVGEPLLALLASWGPQAGGLVALVDGWEAMLADPPDPAVLAEARGAAMALLAGLLGESDTDKARRAGIEWSLAETGDSHEFGPVVLQRIMRPLSILLALEQYQGRGLAGFAKIIRIGLFGR